MVSNPFGARILVVRRSVTGILVVRFSVTGIVVVAGSGVVRSFGDFVTGAWLLAACSIKVSVRTSPSPKDSPKSHQCTWLIAPPSPHGLALWQSPRQRPSPLRRRAGTTTIG